MQESNIAWTDDPDVKRRFEEKYEENEETECWEWTAAKNAPGYGRIRINDVLRYAHRVSYQLYRGEIPDGKQINHHCDNPRCVNPDHIYAGTQSENLDDAVEHGDFIEVRPRGKDNPNTVLDARDARAICHLADSTDHTYRSLADLFDVSKGTIQCVLQGDSWGHVTGGGVR